MAALLPVPEIAWIYQEVYPYMPTPAAMLLGGSRGGKAGQQALASSDYDIILLAEHIEQPLSLTLTSPFSGNKFDIILRDPDTLAYEAESARQGGNGTLLHLCAFSHILMDRGGLARAIQPNAYKFYQQGPLPITSKSFREELDGSRQELAHLCDMDDPVAFRVGAQSLRHRFGRLALRANRHWVANGKVIARFLEQRLPDYKAHMEDVMSNLRPGNTGEAEKLLLIDLPALHVTGDNAVPLQRRHRFPVNPGVAEVYHYGRLSSAALLHYLHPEHFLSRHVANDHTYYEAEPTVMAARDWVTYMFNLTGSAVDSERYHRPNREYDYALGRYLNQMMDTACMTEGIDPATLRLDERATLLAYRLPQLATALLPAQHGKPQALHEAANLLLADVVGRPEPLRPRLAPATLRLDARKVGLL